MHNEVITAYQGEPVSFILADRNEDGSYVPDISSYKLEALLKDSCNRVVSCWSSEGGTIQFDTVEGKGIAGFILSGDNTARMLPQSYSLEVAQVINDDRAIGIARGVLFIKPAKIKKGVPC